MPQGDDGFGLGLSIVQAIADAHGGAVHVEDAEPHGARFVITLPLTATPFVPERGRMPSEPSSQRPANPNSDVPHDDAEPREELSLWQGS